MPLQAEFSALHTFFPSLSVTHTHPALQQSGGPVLMKPLFLKGAEHELCRFVFTWGFFFSFFVAFLCFLFFSYDFSPLSLSLISTHLLISYPSLLLEIMSPKTASLPPPGLPALLLFCFPLHPLSLFFFIVFLSLSWCCTYTHTQTHSYIYTLYFCSLYSHEWSAEQRRGRGLVRCVSDSHKCVKEEKRKSYVLSSAPAALVSLLKRLVTNVRVICSHQIVQYLWRKYCASVSEWWQRRWEKVYFNTVAISSCTFPGRGC